MRFKSLVVLAFLFPLFLDVIIACDDGVYYSSYPPSIHNPVVVGENGRRIYVIDVNLWNTESLDGTVKVKYFRINRSIVVTANINSVHTRDQNTPVIGYPEVWIGCKPWWNPCANDWNISFPTTDFNFTVCIETALNKREGVINVAFDLWFLPVNTKDVDPSKYSDTVELMIWLYYDPMAAEWMIMRGAQVVYLPLSINGLYTLEEFYIYHRAGRWHYIALFPRKRNITNTLVRFNLEDIVDVVEDSYGELINGKYLMGIEVGTEIWKGKVDYTLIIQGFNVEVKKAEPTVGKEVEEEYNLTSITDLIKYLINIFAEKEDVEELKQRISDVKNELKFRISKLETQLADLKEQYRLIVDEVRRIQTLFILAVIISFIAGLVAGYIIGRRSRDGAKSGS